jgi:eukaryotic-like serine/threonine-protein kinase
MPDDRDTLRTVRFGRFELVVETGELRKDGVKLKLSGQAIQVLELLAVRPGKLVTREELQQRLWPGSSYGDPEHGLNAAVNRLREALGDSAIEPKYIETIPGRGYRFVASIDSTPSTNGLVVTENSVPVPGLDDSDLGRLKKNVAFLHVGFDSKGTTIRRSRVHYKLAAMLVIAFVIVGLAVTAWWALPGGRHPLTERDTIVLADFTNETGDAIFDGTLNQALATALSQSPFLNILSDQKVGETLRMMDRPPNEHITLDMAREICERTGSTAMLVGSIANIGSEYVILLKAMNCASTDSLAQEEARASRKEEVLNAVGRAAASLREELGESLASIQKFDMPLEQATTSSLEALKAYNLATRWGGVTPYRSLLKHAIELDPSFALAYVGLSYSYSGAGEAELASAYAHKAYDHRERATERERLTITANYCYAVLGDIDCELAAEHVMQEMYPSFWSHWNDSAASRLLLGDYTQALKESREALQLNPNQSNSYLNPGIALLRLNRKDEVKEIARLARARGMDVTMVHLLVYEVAFLENDDKEMEAQLAPLLAKRDDEGGGAFDALVAQSNTEAYFGHLGNSRRILEQGLKIVQRGKQKELAALVLDAGALREAEFGYRGKARSAAAKALTLSTGRDARLFAALAFARAGDATRAQALADELNSQFPSHTLMQRYWLPTIRASIELNRKNPTKAVEALKSVSYEFGETGYLASKLYPVYVRGQAYLGARQGKLAAAEFQKFVDYRFIASNSPLAALARLGLARAYLLQGDRVMARRAYQDFLDLWEDADPDIPILQQAKEEYSKLNAQ